MTYSGIINDTLGVASIFRGVLFTSQFIRQEISPKIIAATQNKTLRSIKCEPANLKRRCFPISNCCNNTRESSKYFMCVKIKVEEMEMAGRECFSSSSRWLEYFTACFPPFLNMCKNQFMSETIEIRAESKHHFMEVKGNLYFMDSKIH